MIESYIMFGRPRTYVVFLCWGRVEGGVCNNIHVDDEDDG